MPVRSSSDSDPGDPALRGAEGDESSGEDAAILHLHGFEPDPVIEAYKRDVDRSLLRENLMRAPEERWRILSEATALAEELRRAGAAARGD